MAFIASSVATFGATTLKTSKTCALGGARVSNVRAARRSTVVAAPRMDAGKYPKSAVLGVGADIPSSLFLMSSVLAFPLGCYCVYMSNIASPLMATSVNPQFIIGSLLVPISWGLHVAGFIQMKNDK